MSSISAQDRQALIQDKYHGNPEADISADTARIEAGEPLAYVIGWIPFHGLRISLATHPLIPRPETENWTELLIERLKKRGDKPCTVLDLCAGSGAIGLSILAASPTAHVSFGELESAHIDLIKQNIEENGLDVSRTTIRRGNLFVPFVGERFDVIATNPPYIPEGRILDQGVTTHEPAVALFSGPRGLDVIERIAREAPKHLNPGGELWMECDIENIEEACEWVLEGGAMRADIRTDQYGRPRTVVGYYP